MVALLKHDTKWLAPASLWSQFSEISTAQQRENFQRPAILRFNNDAFMQELISLMNLYPERLTEWKAQPETWREPMPTPPTRELLPIEEPLSELLKKQTRELKAKSLANISQSTNAALNNNLPLKLFQPLHKRFYLVTASLVCRRVGLPDKKVDLEKDQKVKFVLRRLIPKDPDAEIANPDVCDVNSCDEYAYVLEEDQMQWKKVIDGSASHARHVIAEEERLPMSPMGYVEEGGQTRKLLSGFIPVSRREAYVSTPVTFSESQSLTDNIDKKASVRRDAITHLFSVQVAGPWKRVISMAQNDSNVSSDWLANAPLAATSHNNFPDPDVPNPLDAGEVGRSNLKATREKIQTTSWYVLVDMLTFFKDYIPRVHLFIADGVAPENITQEELELYDALGSVTLNTAEYVSYINECYHPASALKISLIDALNELIQNPGIETELDLIDYFYDRENANVGSEYHWPNFLFPLADPLLNSPIPNLFIENPSDNEPDISHDQLDALTDLVRNTIPEDANKPAPDLKPPKPPQKDNSGGWFVIRCVYEAPNCGPFNPPLVSESTVPFKMAATYDPDAPGRPINIPMPLDISPAGLRKHQKNANFMISDMLCGKLRGARKTTLGDLVLSVLPWPFHKDLPEPGDGKCSKGGVGFGMICSLSIPIVTLCAMILLTIMVTLFDIFFRWIPYFFLCLPIPGLKGKD